MVSKYFKKPDMTNKSIFKLALKKGLKVAYLDIETSPYLAWTYSLFKPIIKHSQIVHDMKITSVVILEEGKTKPEVFQWTHAFGVGTDHECIGQMSNRLQNFDIVIMQNGDSYDVKVLQERLLHHKLTPLKNLITIDTLKLSRKSFKKASHSLESRSSAYGYGGKLQQNMLDCIAVAEGDKSKQKARIKYNIKDVLDTRKVFFRELDYYDLGKPLLNFLHSFAKEDKVFCQTCAKRRQRRFDVRSRTITLKTGEKYTLHTCNNCLRTWGGPVEWLD